MFEQIQALIGPVPSGYEPVVYVLCVVVVMWLLSQVVGLVWSLLGGLLHVG